MKNPIKRKKTKALKPRKRTLGGSRKDVAKAARLRGKKGELDARDLWRNQGFRAERTIQVRGGRGAADVTIEGVSEFFHCEVKNVEQFSLYPSLRQAEMDSGKMQIPFVMHKRNGQKFVVVLDAEHFIGLVKQAGYSSPKLEVELL